MLKKILIFAVISLNIYSSQLDIFKEEYKQIKNEIEKAEVNNKKSWSESNYLKLEKELISKNLEIIKEKNKGIKDKFQIENELKKTDKTLEILDSKIKEYESKKEMMEKNREVISDMDIKNIEYNIFNLEEQIKLNKRAKEYYLKQLKDIPDLKDWKIKNITEEIQKTYKLLEKISNQDLEIAKAGNLGEKEIETKESNLKIIELKKEEELKNIRKQRDSLSKDLADNNSNLKISEAKLKILELEKEMLINKSKVGLASKTELFDKDMEYLNKLIEKLDYESKIEYLKMELEE